MIDSHRCEPAQHDRGGLTLGLSFIHKNASGQMGTLLHVRLWVGTRRDTLVTKSLSCNAQILCIENRGRDCGSKVLSRFERISHTIKRSHRSPRQGVRVLMGDQGTTRGTDLGRACVLRPDGVRWKQAKLIVLPPRNSAAAGGAPSGVHPMPSAGAIRGPPQTWGGKGTRLISLECVYEHIAASALEDTTGERQPPIRCNIARCKPQKIKRIFLRHCWSTFSGGAKSIVG